MELSSSDSIRALIAAYGNPKPVHHRDGTPDIVRSARKSRRMTCRCGHCPQCLDNARWERIFVEKFADPTYYGRTVIRTASPLTSI